MYPCLTALRHSSRVLCLSLLVAATCATAADGRAGRYYEDALNRYEKRDLPGAIIQLKNALQIDKSMLPVQLLLGKALMANGEVLAAEVALLEALRLGVDRAEVVLPLAQAYLAQGKHRQLLDDATFAMGGLPVRTRIELWILRASALSDLGDPRGAMHAIEQARALDMGAPGSWLAEVPVRVRARQLSEAAAAADRALALAPQLAEARYQRGSVYHVQGDVRAAISAYDQVLALDADHVEARIARAGLYLDMQRDAEAAADLARLQRLSDQEPRAAYLRAMLAEREGNSAQAKLHLTQVTNLLDAAPAQFIQYRSQLLLLNGLAHLGLGEDEKAQAYLESLERVQGSSPASKALAQLYLKQGASERGISVLSSYVRAVPGDKQALMQLAAAYTAQGRNAQAISLMQEALRGDDRPDMRAALGVGLVGSGRIGQGVNELEAALRKDPGQVQAGTVLAGLYLRAGQGAKAAKVAQELVKRDANNAVFQDLLGMALAQTGDTTAARSAFQRAIQLDAALLAPQLHLARLDTGMRAYDAAAKRLQELLAKDGKNIEVLLELALLADQRGQPRQMEDWLRKADDHAGALELRPVLALTDLYLRMQQPGPALEAARRANSKAPPEDLPTQLAYGRALAANGDKVAARAAYMAASRLAGANAPLLVRIAHLQLAAQHADGAAYSLEKALTARPDLLPAQALMVDVEIQRRQFADAARRAAQITQQYPKLAVGHSLEGDIALARGQQAAAIEAYRRAHQVAPAPDTFMRLSSVLWEVDGGRPAVQLAEQWVRQRPSDLEARRAVADAYARAGQYVQARSGYETLLKTAPQDAGALNNLANVLVRLGDPAAVAAAERAVALAPEDANALDTLGWALFKAGGDAQRERALGLLRTARLRAPGNPGIRYHLAAVLAQSGRPAEARQEAQGALDAEPRFESRADAELLLKSLR
nr:XrtA/PEP-CTERM system TPR-repeat protein PrsT [Variovorax boronicumulans]